MNIAYLSTFYPYRGGIAQFNASLYRALEKKYNIKAFTFLRQYPEILFPGKSQLVSSNDNVDIVPSLKVLDTINPVSFSRATNKILEFRPDLLLTKFWMPFFAPSLGSVSKKLKQKNIINISILDNVLPHEKKVGDIALIKYFLNQQHGFIVMSDTVKDDLLSLKPNAKYEKFYHPIYDHFGHKVSKEDARRSLKIPLDKNVLLFFGFIRDYKGLDLLLKAMKLLPDNYHLIIAGEVYGNFDKYKDLINRLNIQNRVTVEARYIRDSEVPYFFSASDVCVLPYKSATQSGIVAISFQFNLPVIATDVGSLKEMLVPTNTGLIVEKPDANLLSQGIIKYFVENKKEQYKNNIDAYKVNYSWDNLANTILKLYSNLTLEMQI